MLPTEALETFDFFFFLQRLSKSCVKHAKCLMLVFSQENLKMYCFGLILDNTNVSMLL